MSDKPVVEVSVRAIFPTNAGSAVFLGNDDKVFVIYVDPAVGMAIGMGLRKMSRERPQTHDLIGRIFTGLGAAVDRIVINDFDDGVYYARLLISMDNELGSRKIVEIDARPSDCLAIALQQDAPIYIAVPVWENADDMSDILMKMENKGLEFGEDDEA